MNVSNFVLMFFVPAVVVLSMIALTAGVLFVVHEIARFVAKKINRYDLFA